MMRKRTHPSQVQLQVAAQYVEKDMHPNRMQLRVAAQYVGKVMHPRRMQLQVAYHATRDTCLYSASVAFDWISGLWAEIESLCLLHLH